VDIRTIAETIGYPAAALGILIESTGIPFPGELTLVAVAAYAGAGHLNIVIVIILAALGAVAGGDLGYLIGRKGGRPFIEKLLSIFRLEVAHLAQAEMFFAHHGDKTILVGRFILGLRSWASVFAGVAHMPFRPLPALQRAGGGPLGDHLGRGGLPAGQQLAPPDDGYEDGRLRRAGGLRGGGGHVSSAP